METEGTVEIDGVDIKSVDLYYLRSKVGVLLAEPVVIKGSIRENIDPLKQHSDRELEQALRKVTIWE